MTKKQRVRRNKIIMLVSPIALFILGLFLIPKITVDQETNQSMYDFVFKVTGIRDFFTSNIEILSLGLIIALVSYLIFRKK